jgi:Spy/CpxP family protein refolding chaperone
MRMHSDVKTALLAVIAAAAFLAAAFVSVAPAPYKPAQPAPHMQPQSK